jgi:nicotinamide-nucleotide amidase
MNGTVGAGGGVGSGVEREAGREQGAESGGEREAGPDSRRENPRAGILVTGTEVLTGIISDRNGPWLSERLRELGVDAAMIQIVGDRPEDLLAALRYMARERMTLVITSGGLGPTADDLTAEVVGRFSDRRMVLDAALEERIAEILRPMMSRWPGLDQDAIRASNRKQAVIPEGATVLEPVGTAPGLVVPPGPGSEPTVVVLPGPPRELQPMWGAATRTEAFRAAVRGAPTYRREIVRLFGIPESEIANTLRAAEAAGLSLGALEITTCLRRGEIEIATRFEPSDEAAYDRLLEFIASRHADSLFSRDGTTVDEQIAQLLSGRTIAVAESCTGGLMAARLTERAGSSAYFAGGVVPYSDAAKTELVGVDAAVIRRVGAVSSEVAEALADGAAERFEADVGVGITGIAGPSGGSAAKPVGLVCFSVCRRSRGGAPGSGGRITRSIQLPGGRLDVRERSTTVTMHLLRRLLGGEVGEIGEGDEVGDAGEVGEADEMLSREAANPGSSGARELD